MSAIYLETSALLHWLLGQDRAGLVESRLDAADAVVASVLTLTEARRALVRAERTGVLRAADLERLRGVLARLEATWILMDVTAEVRARAEEAFPVEPVRTLDALHLATALLFARAQEGFSVLSFDERVLRNAAALGLDVATA
jgi:predicted nucleic acid-binding protein